MDIMPVIPTLREGNLAPPVDQRIGDAYHVINEVHANLAAIKLLAEGFNDFEVNAEEAITARNEAEEFKNITQSDAEQTSSDRVQTGADLVATQTARDEAVESAEQTALDVIATDEAKVAAALSEENALASRYAAEIAKDAALVVGDVFENTTLGIAGTSSGDYFWIPSVEDYSALSLYKNNSGTPVDTEKRITDSSRISFAGLRYRSCLPVGIESVAWEIKDPQGKRGAAMTHDGFWMVQKLKMMSVGNGYRTSGYVFDLADTDGNRVFAVDNKGSIFLKLTKKALNLLSNQINIYSPDAWRGSASAEDILATDKLVNAKIEDTATVPSWYGDITMPRDSSTLCAIAKGTGRLQLYLYVGQSNSQASGVDDSILVEQRFPYHALKYVAGSMSDGASAIDINTLNDIVATQDFQRPYPHNSAAMSSLYRSRMMGETTDPILGRADGKGGAPLTDFLKTASPSYCYDNAMTTVEASYDIAKSYGMDLDVTIVFVQGENSGTSGSGTSIATYQGWLSTLLNDYVTDVKAIINRVPKIIITSC
jgi:hypothetical protein